MSGARSGSHNAGMRSNPVEAIPAHHDVRALSSTCHRQLAGRHSRLERELALAFGMQPWPGALIARLADELQQTEEALGLTLRPAA